MLETKATSLTNAIYGKWKKCGGNRYTIYRQFVNNMQDPFDWFPELSHKDKKENIEIAYCPTEEMIADFYTKPLQGYKFRKFCEFIMGVTFDEFDFVLREERVEDSPKMDLF